MPTQNMVSSYLHESNRNDKKKVNIYNNSDYFVILIGKNKEFDNSLLNLQLSKKKNILYGYVFTDNSLLNKLSKISNEDFLYLKKNHNTLSGVYCCLGIHKDSVEIILDPLLQYNIFYYIGKESITISNNIFYLWYANRKHLNINYNFLFDTIATYNPQGQSTFFADVHTLCIDDIINDKNGLLKIKCVKFFCDYRFDYTTNFTELKNIYAKRLCSRAKILHDNFDEIHMALTGGADSRLALAALMKYGKCKLYTYTLGDERRTDKIIADIICSRYKIKREKYMQYFGPSSCLKNYIKWLFDSSALKLYQRSHTIDSDSFLHSNVCHVTGYYGVNISNGVIIPEYRPVCLKYFDVPKKYFTYFDYISDFKKRYSSLRVAALQDIYYICNRGKYHCACSSINYSSRANSVDILYDPINLYLVIACDYPDEHINRGALSVDIIHKINSQLALCPYNDRKIPLFKNIRQIPVINCFDGFEFLPSTEPRIPNSVIESDCYSFDLFGYRDKILTVLEILKLDVFKDFFDNFDFLRNVFDNDKIPTEILTSICSFALTEQLIKNFSKIKL